MQVGTPRELYDHPNNVFVAGFIGSPAMNILNLPMSENGAIIGGKIGLPQTLELTPAEGGSAAVESVASAGDAARMNDGRRPRRACAPRRDADCSRIPFRR